jgi:hypothetical protein
MPLLSLPYYTFTFRAESGMSLFIVRTSPSSLSARPPLHCPHVPLFIVRTSPSSLSACPPLHCPHVPLFIIRTSPSSLSARLPCPLAGIPAVLMPACVQRTFECCVCSVVARAPSPAYSAGSEWWGSTDSAGCNRALYLGISFYFFAFSGFHYFYCDYYEKILWLRFFVLYASYNLKYAYSFVIAFRCAHLFEMTVNVY